MGIVKPKEANMRKIVSRRRSRAGGLIALSALIAVAAAACGSSSSSSAQSGAGTSAQQASSSGFAEAAKLAKTYGAGAKSIGITQPVGKPIPTGKTIVLVGAGQSGVATVLTYNAFKEAASILGWNVKEIQPATPNPQDEQAALEQAIQLHPDAVTISSIDPSSVAAQLKQLRSMNIPVVETYGPSNVWGVGQLVTVNIFTETRLEALAKALADKLLADMGHPGAIGAVGVDGYQAVQGPYYTTFVNEIKRLCPTCTVTQLLLPLTSLGSSDGADIVNFLRSHPDIKALYSQWDYQNANLQAAARSAGVTLPKIYSEGTWPTNISQVASGVITATAPIDYPETGWRQADVLARIFTGQTASALTVDAKYGPPTLWSNSFNNVPAAPQGDAFPPTVPDYQAEYKALWGK